MEGFSILRARGRSVDEMPLSLLSIKLVKSPGWTLQYLQLANPTYRNSYDFIRNDSHDVKDIQHRKKTTSCSCLSKRKRRDQSI